MKFSNCLLLIILLSSQLSASSWCCWKKKAKPQPNVVVESFDDILKVVAPDTPGIRKMIADYDREYEHDFEDILKAIKDQDANKINEIIKWRGSQSFGPIEKEMIENTCELLKINAGNFLEHLPRIPMGPVGPGQAPRTMNLPLKLLFVWILPSLAIAQGLLPDEWINIDIHGNPLPCDKRLEFRKKAGIIWGVAILVGGNLLLGIPQNIINVIRIRLLNKKIKDLLKEAH